MVLVIANVYVKDGRQDLFLDAAKKCIDSTLKEEGNNSYELKADAFDKCSFTFVESWKSAEVLDLHMNTEHFKVFGASIHDILAKDLEISIYNAEKTN